MTTLPAAGTIRTLTLLVAALASGASPFLPAADVRRGEGSQPYLGLDSPGVAEGDEGTTTLTFTARLTDANGQPQASTDTITANYDVLSEGDNTATAGTDYEATSGTLTFLPGEGSTRPAWPTGGRGDDDADVRRRLRALATARLTDANGQPQAGTDTITANYDVLSEGDNTATAGTDYEATSGTLIFLPGETSRRRAGR